MSCIIDKYNNIIENRIINYENILIKIKIHENTAHFRCVSTKKKNTL